MNPPDEKAGRILDAAREVFARLGYRKTSMQDVADAAGISRAALYLRFRNKQDLFVQGATAVLAEVLEATRAALEVQAPFIERLRQAMLAFTAGLLEPFDQTGHGRELLETSNHLAERIEAEHTAEIRQLLCKHIEQSAATGEITLPVGTSARQLADLIHISGCALKHEGDGLPALRQRVTQFAGLLGQALVPVNTR